MHIQIFVRKKYLNKKVVCLDVTHHYYIIYIIKWKKKIKKEHQNSDDHMLFYLFIFVLNTF